MLKLTSHLRATVLQQGIHCSLRHRILRAALLQLLQLLLATLALHHRCKQIREEATACQRELPKQPVKTDRSADEGRQSCKTWCAAILQHTGREPGFCVHGKLKTSGLPTSVRHLSKPRTPTASLWAVWLIWRSSLRLLKALCSACSLVLTYSSKSMVHQKNICDRDDILCPKSVHTENPRWTCFVD